MAFLGASTPQTPPELAPPAPMGAAFGRRPPILGTPIGAGGARPGGPGGREPPQEFSQVLLRAYFGAPLFNMAGPQVMETKTKAVQSQTTSTYVRKVVTPRFEPLPEMSHGCFPEG